MIESQVRTTYGSLEVSSPNVAPSARSASVAATVAAPTPKTTQGPGFTTHVVSPTTLLAAQETREANQNRRTDTPKQNAGEQGQGSASSSGSASDTELTPEEQQQVAKLKKVDREVRAHERAHRSAGGSLTGPAQYTYTRGPDGQMYAVSGEVSIDTGREKSAAATVEKMEAVIRAALAPANPSAQDIAVAAQARQILNEVSQEAREERLNVDGQKTGEEASSAVDTAGFSHANRAYREQGAQDGQAFLNQQARDALQISADQGFSFTI